MLNPFWLILEIGSRALGQQTMLHHSRDAQRTRFSVLSTVYYFSRFLRELMRNRCLKNTELEIYNRLETTYTITSSIWMQICGRSGSKTKAGLPLMGKSFFSHTYSPGWSLLSLGRLMPVHIRSFASSFLCSRGLTSLVFANPHL